MKRFIPTRAWLVLGLLWGGTGFSWGATTLIHAVLDGLNVSGAEVFVDGRLRGKTDAQGNLNVDTALLQNNKTVISARSQVYEHPAYLGGHGDAASPRGWVFRAFVTSVVIDDTGTVNTFVVKNKTATQELVLKRDNVLIGLQVLVSADWDMSAIDYPALMRTFQDASRYLWNATDGQFIFERVKIADQAQDWSSSEFQLYLDNTLRPRTSQGGYLSQNGIGKLFGGYISTSWRDSTIHIDGPNGGWAAADPKTFIHEFGHLGFSLGDEYGYTAHEVCTVRLDSDKTGDFRPGGKKAACVMNDQTLTQKFCSDQGPNSHNHTWFQPDDCWATLRGHYSDPSSARWTLKTPVTRAVLLGPLGGPSVSLNNAFPLEWNTTFAVTNKGWPTEICAPFLQPATDANGAPDANAPVKLVYKSIDPTENTWISEGKTMSNGKLAIVGSHAGDSVMTQTAMQAFPACPMGVWPPGPLGWADGDQDGDHVPDGYDACPALFNPFDFSSGALAQRFVSSCSCSGNADCSGGLVCVAGSGGAKKCVLPLCRIDADCGTGSRCQTDAAGNASCIDSLGTHCQTNADCTPHQCDAGNGTSRTGLCMPTAGRGQTGNVCSNNNQCAGGNCSGLAPVNADTWKTGQCSDTLKALGDYCNHNSLCASGYCDAGTSRCMPNHDGQNGDICSNNNQCASSNCGGLSNLNAALPGACAPKRALGVPCGNKDECASGYCDAGLMTSHTYLCMPNKDGSIGTTCSNDNQCVSGNCEGLTKNNVGNWVPGVCGAKRSLGALCSANDQCGSTFCDTGNGTSHTDRCMPNNDGTEGQPCSNDKHCFSGNCGGLLMNSSGGWIPGQCADKLSLGKTCNANAQCQSTYCDTGNGTSHTDLCMPRNNGQIGNLCSNDNQCASSVCAGLVKNMAGNWVPGHCESLRTLGDACTQNYQCGSNYCDAGNGTSRTNRCMPHTNGKPGDICSHHNQCASRICGGLTAQGNNWIPGQCQ